MDNDNFRNRLDTQRDVLELINKYSWKEEIFGLSVHKMQHLIS